MSSTDESCEEIVQTPVDANAEPDTLMPRFEHGKRKKKKSHQDASPASRYFRKPVVAD